MLTRLKQLGAALAAVVLMAGSAQAATVIDFRVGNADAGGTITWDGTNLIGANIPIGGVAISGAPTGNGVHPVQGLAMDVSGNLWGSLNFNTAQNTISISGCVAALGVGTTGTDPATCDPVTLMSGSFTSYTADGNGLQIAAGFDTKNEELLDAINWPTDLPWAFFGYSMTTTTLQPGQTGTAISTDIRNTAVPEPTTMMLLGTGLLAAFRARRRQQA